MNQQITILKTLLDKDGNYRVLIPERCRLSDYCQEENLIEIDDTITGDRTWMSVHQVFSKNFTIGCEVKVWHYSHELKNVVFEFVRFYGIGELCFRKRHYVVAILGTPEQYKAGDIPEQQMFIPNLTA